MDVQLESKTEQQPIETLSSFVNGSEVVADPVICIKKEDEIQPDLCCPKEEPDDHKQTDTGQVNSKTIEGDNPITNMSPPPPPPPPKSTPSKQYVPDPSFPKNLRYTKYYRIVRDCNGGAKSLHMDYDRIKHLPFKEIKELSKEFISESFREVNEVAVYVISVIHNAAKYQYDWLEWLAKREPNLKVKAGVIGQKSAIETTTIGEYVNNVS